MTRFTDGLPAGRCGLHIVSATETPLRTQAIRILAKLRFLSLQNRDTPPAAETPEMLTQELNRYLTTHLGEHHPYGVITVTEINGAERSSSMITCPVHAYSYFNPERINEQTDLRNVLEEATVRLEALSASLEATPDWRLFFKKPYLAPAEGEGFSPWLHNAIVTAGVDSSLAF
jgi:hypothetical protein